TASSFPGRAWERGNVADVSPGRYGNLLSWATRRAETNDHVSAARSTAPRPAPARPAAGHRPRPGRTHGPGPRPQAAVRLRRRHGRRPCSPPRDAVGCRVRRTTVAARTGLR